MRIGTMMKFAILAGGLALGSAAYATEHCPEGDPNCNAPPPDDGPKGNNGWGNGSDAAEDGSGGTNNGSDNGATADSKSSNGAAGHHQNPRFTGR